MRKLVSLFVFFMCAALNAQISEEIFESFKLQERRPIKYYIPEDYTPEKKYPLVIVLDAEFLFDNVLANAKFYADHQGMPQAIIVGIDQGEEELRWDDCEFEEETGLPSEKGKKFFEFLGLEIVPYIATKYSTAPFKMIVGYDITANFGNFYLFKEKSLFNSFVSISPLLAPEMENRVPQRLAALDQQIFYHLIVEGEKSKETPQIEAMDKGIKELNKESLHYFYDVYTDANDITIATYGLSKAWDDIFSIFRPISPKEYKEKLLTYDGPVFDYLDNKYKTIEDLFGFKKVVELNDIMAIYAGSRKKEDFKSLKPLAELCKLEYPDTMMGFYFEGEYFEQLGEPKKALKSFEKAFGMDEIDFLTKELALEKMDALKADFGF